MRSRGGAVDSAPVQLGSLRVGAHQLTMQNKCLYTSLAEADPEVHDLVEKETWRQFSGLELIASEVSYRHQPRSGMSCIIGRESS